MPDAQKLVPHPEHAARAARAVYGRLVYGGGEAYKRGNDDVSEPILPRYENETAKMYAARVSGTCVAAIAEDVIPKRCAEVFATPPQRPALTTSGGDDMFSAWAADVDRSGHGIDSWMSDRLRDGLIMGSVFVGIDAPPLAPGDEKLTLAQVRADKSKRPYAVYADPCAVEDWQADPLGGLARIAIRYSDVTKADVLSEPVTRKYVVEWTAETVRRIVETKDGPAVESEQPNRFGFVPWFELAPLGGQSYCMRVAPSQKAATRADSLLECEHVACTFTRLIGTGMTAEDIAGAVTGPGEMLCVAQSEARVFTIAGDPSVTEQLRATLAQRLAEGYRRAESARGVVSAQPSSGVALAYEFLGLGALLQAMASACEEAENRLIRMWAVVAGLAETLDSPEADDLASTRYAREFDILSDEAVLNRYQWILEQTTLPIELRRAVVRSLVERLYPVDDDRRQGIMDAIDEWKDPSPGEQLLNGMRRPQQPTAADLAAKMRGVA